MSNFFVKKNNFYFWNIFFKLNFHLLQDSDAAALRVTSTRSEGSQAIKILKLWAAWRHLSSSTTQLYSPKITNETRKQNLTLLLLLLFIAKAFSSFFLPETVGERKSKQINAFTTFYVAAGVVWAQESRKIWLDSNHSYLYNIMFFDLLFFDIP